MNKADRNIILEACDTIEEGEWLGCCMAIVYGKMNSNNDAHRSKLADKFEFFYHGEFYPGQYWYPRNKKGTASRIIALLLFAEAEEDVL